MTAPGTTPVGEDLGERLALEFGLPAATGRLLAFRAIAIHPGLARGVFAQHAALRHGGLLSGRLRELLIMRVAWRAGSAYEWAQHWNIARAEGIAAEDLAGLREEALGKRYSAAERAVLAVVDEVFERRMVQEATWSACVLALGDVRAALEAVAAAVHWAGLAVLFRTLQLPLEEGMTLWPPDGRAPG